MKCPDLKLILLRHAEAASNAEKRLNSPEDALTEQGKLQAKSISVKLADFKITKIITSDENRAKSTAEIISKTIKCPISENALIREKSSGEFAGRLVSSIDWAPINANPDFYTKKLPSGESVNDVINRAKQFIDLLAKETGTVLVVTHSSFIRIILGLIFNQDIKNLLLNMEIPNCGYVILNRKENQWVIEETSFANETFRTKNS
ncbi:MAG: histidine phosphatase family protein [Candidatus Nitrosotenuis sp.]